jgi:hypothetical protein
MQNCSNIHSDLVPGQSSATDCAVQITVNRLTVAGAVREPSGVGGLNPGLGVEQELTVVPCRFQGNRPLQQNAEVTLSTESNRQFRTDLTKPLLHSLPLLKMLCC